MKKVIMTKKILILISTFLIFSAEIFSATAGYIIKEYQVKISIDEKNKYKVSEKIDVNFKEKRRGIIRALPLAYNKRNIKLSNILVDSEFSESNNYGFREVRIGNPNIYLSGDQTYNISYEYNFGYDKIKYYDEVYYNIIGTEWDTSIDKVYFEISLPKDFDPNKINFTSGEFGSTEKAPVIFEVKNNVITGYTTEPLLAGEALTIALPLPEKYFDVFSFEFVVNFLKYFINFSAIFGIFLAVFLWWKHGKNKPVVETVEFYPPNNMNPSEVGYYIDTVVDNIDITSLIIYWADNGYLEISEEKGEVSLKKLKDMEEKNSYEHYFFNSLFMYAPDKKNIQINKLNNIFYEHVEETKKLIKIDHIMSHKKFFTSKSLAVGSFIKAFPFFLLILLIIRYIFDYQIFSFSSQMLLGLITIINFPIIFLTIIFCIIFGGLCKRRTDDYNEIYGRILGFKRFLEMAEKDKLESLVKENPKYFYNILPYTMVLGVSGVWTEKFKELTTSPPNWYHSAGAGNIFTTYIFMSSLSRAMNSFNNNLYSRPTPKSDSGFGGGSFGGGFSGGGGGGGGGRSW
ncbi:MAG: DUF2207 domain-containing protein [Fusobacteriaceae bacterium]